MGVVIWTILNLRTLVVYILLVCTVGMGLMGFSFVFTLGKGLRRADFFGAIHP